MKQPLLAATAIAGLALMVTPAQADGLDVDAGGVFRGYAVWADDEAGNDVREFDFRRDSEIYVSGETTLDNGLTVGVHSELDLGTAVETDEVYAYFSGGWGRINFGVEDGAAYLLQVAAPSADSNVDGLRTYIQGFDARPDDTTTNIRVDYDNAPFEATDRLTYLTPKFNGFQAGLSYAPEEGANAVGNNLAGMATDDDAGEFEDLWEVAFRWDGEWEGIGVKLGAGYTSADTEEDAATPALGVFADGADTWNLGATFSWEAFSLGAAYLDQEATFGDGATAGGVDVDLDLWVVGAGWQNGPYTLGVSHLDADGDAGSAGTLAVVEGHRTTFGGTYTYGPGMTFRGAVAFGEAGLGGLAEEDFSQVTVGTQINF